MSEFRRDPITGEWVIVVPGRGARPNEHVAAPPSVPAAPDCPFCEGNESKTPPEVAVAAAAARRPNERGWQVRVIPNRFPTVMGDPPGTGREESSSTFVRRAGFGYHEVIIESPAHSPTFPYLSRDQALRVLRVCRDRARELSGRAGIVSTTLFENAGPESGGSLWHPHAQLVATPELSPSLRSEVEGAERLRERLGGQCPFEQVRDEEVRDGARVVFESSAFTAFAPFASAYPFELRVIPSRHTPSFGDANDSEVEVLSEQLPALLRSFLSLAPGASYNFVVKSPAGTMHRQDRYHWHLDVYPRLVRPDGFDLGSGFHVNTVAPEEAAQSLRAALGAKS